MLGKSRNNPLPMDNISPIVCHVSRSLSSFFTHLRRKCECKYSKGGWRKTPLLPEESQFSLGERTLCNILWGDMIYRKDSPLAICQALGFSSISVCHTQSRIIANFSHPTLRKWNVSIMWWKALPRNCNCLVGLTYRKMLTIHLLFVSAFNPSNARSSLFYCIPVQYTRT